MAELFELEEEVIRMSSDVKDKYERDMAKTATGAKNLPVRHLHNAFPVIWTHVTIACPL